MNETRWCPLCNKQVKVTEWHRHVKTKKHLRHQARQTNIEPVAPSPDYGDRRTLITAQRRTLYDMFGIKSMK